MRSPGCLRTVDNPSDPSDPSDQRIRTLREPSGAYQEMGAPLRNGGLLFTDDNGNPNRMIESLAAVSVATSMYGRIAWDATAGTWWLWATTHWAPAKPGAIEKLIADAVHIGTEPIGFRPAYLSGLTQIIQRRGLLPRPAPAVGVIPFRNGLLDLRTMALRPARPNDATEWVLPHDYDPDADCPSIKAWLLDAVDGDTESVDLLRAWLAALVRGIPLQHFLLLLGRGGSGKGTFQRLASALIGDENKAISSLRALEGNRFEVSRLYGKRLVMINEAGQHGGALDMLKAITGGDYLPMERKHVQQNGSFVFDGLVLMASNEDLHSTDSTSGLERRRLTVQFDRGVSAQERATWAAKGGEDQVLHAEIPGVINWIMALTSTEIRARFDRYPARVEADNLRALMAGNSVADWMVESCVFEPTASAQVGSKCEIRNGAEVAFENAQSRLYPSYLTHHRASGRTRPVSLPKFTSTVLDIGRKLGHPVDNIRHPSTRASTLLGLRLARDGERPTHLPDLGGFPEGSRNVNSLIRNELTDDSKINRASADNTEIF